MLRALNSSDSTSDNVQFRLGLQGELCQIQIFNGFRNFLYHVSTEHVLKQPTGYRSMATKTARCLDIQFLFINFRVRFI